MHSERIIKSHRPFFTLRIPNKYVKEDQGTKMEWNKWVRNVIFEIISDIGHIPLLI